MALAVALAAVPASAQSVVPVSTAVIALEPFLHPAADDRALVDRIAELQAQLEKLEAKAQTPPAAPGPRVSAGRQGFNVQSADGSFRLRLRGYLHSDARFLTGDGGAPGTRSFLLRRVRPIVEVTSFNRFDLRLMPDFGEGRVVLQDAYADLRFGKTFRVRTGKFKSPFGLERLMSATDLPFPERGAPTLLAPNRDLGVMATGDIRGLATYQVALTNGVADGASADLDESGGKDVVARVFAYAFRNRGPAALRGLGVGGAASAGTETGSRATPGLPAFRTTAAQTWFRYRADGTLDGTSLADGSRVRGSLQALWHYTRAGVVAEWTHTSERVRRGDATDTVDSRAWVTVASFVLTGEAATPRGVTPRHEFDPGSGGWGALELTARVSQLALDRAVFPTFADPATAARVLREWAIGVNWYLNGGVKITSSFHRSTFTGGAPAGGNRLPENLLLSRLQFLF